MRKVLILILVFLGACTKKQAPSNSSGSRDSTVAVENALYDQGKAVYLNNCIACHNMDPKQAGVLGPDIYGSSQELIESKVLRNEYPAGYGPKRSTKNMIALPMLKDKISALHEYLNKSP